MTLPDFLSEGPYGEIRVTDHRIGYTVHQLDLFMEGAIGDLIDALVAHFQAEKLKAQTEEVAS